MSQTVVNGTPVTSQTFYDEEGKVVRTIDPENNQTTTTYNEIGQRTVETDQAGLTIAFEYDWSLLPCAVHGRKSEARSGDAAMKITYYEQIAPDTRSCGYRRS